MQLSDMLNTVRMCVNDLGVKNAAVRDVFAEAEKHGWERLVGSMSNEDRATLVRMLAEDTQAAHAVLEAVVGIYEQIIEELVAVTEQELDLVLADRVERAPSRGSWLELLAAGGVGYMIGKRA